MNNSKFLIFPDLPCWEESSSTEDIGDEDNEAGGDGDGDETEVLHQLELDDVLHVGHGQARLPAGLTRHSLGVYSEFLNLTLLNVILKVFYTCRKENPCSSSDFCFMFFIIFLRTLSLLLLVPLPPSSSPSVPQLAMVSRRKLLFLLTLWKLVMDPLIEIKYQ